jgi:hypothetical protein
LIDAILLGEAKLPKDSPHMVAFCNVSLGLDLTDTLPSPFFLLPLSLAHSPKIFASVGKMKTVQKSSNIYST